MNYKTYLLILLMTPFLWGCAGVSEVTPHHDYQMGCQYLDSGLASWYGKEMAKGKKNGQLIFNPTASGEKFNPDGISAAHRKLPFGTYVRVVLDKPGADPEGVVVRINDRGPFARGRIIDLSWGAAKKLGMMNTQPVHIYQCSGM